MIYACVTLVIGYVVSRATNGKEYADRITDTLFGWLDKKEEDR